MNSPQYVLRMSPFERFFIFPVAAMTLFVALALAQSPSQTHTALDQQKEFRRKNFASGRDLLIQKGVPFDPDELLEDDWPKRLKAVLETMPEMRETRYETAPLKGVYFADTFYLPEVVVLSGDTVVVTNHLVFEGVNPVIKGPHALHIFRSAPSVVLGATLAEIMGKAAGRAKVSFNRITTLPSIRSVLPAAHPRPHTITFDTSAPSPKRPERIRPPLPNRNLLSVSWRPVVAELQLPQDGPNGANGTPGTDGQAGANGINFGASANGSCPNSPNGQNGINGSLSPAQPGGNGGDGGNGADGGDGGAITDSIADGDTNTYAYSARGGAGGLGGYGGNGGLGGVGATGGDGGNGVTCGCNVGFGGNAGAGGAGMAGGNGGNGGAGGNGGNGGTISVSIPYGDSARVSGSASGGTGGSGGSGGYGNTGGHGGAAGHAGSAGPAACGNTGQNGFTALPGGDGGTGSSGNSGASGNSGNTGSVSISERSGVQSVHN